MFNKLEDLGEEGRQPYIRQTWNMLDFIVVVASVTDFYIFISGKSSGGALKSLKALRALRALRPLRVIARNEGLRLVVNALLSSIPAMTNVILVCFLFLLIFAIMGINFFKG
jgi:Na+/alanine symporter